MDGLVKAGSIGAILLQSNIITEDELKAALEDQRASGGRVGEALIRLGIVTQEDIDWALSNQLNIPYVRLRQENVDPEAVEKVPPHVARRYLLFPIFLAGDQLSVVMADPLNQQAIDELTSVTGCRIDISIGLIREIREMQEIFYGPAELIPELGFTSNRFSPKAMESINLDMTASALLNHLLLCLVSQKFSTLAMQPLGDQVLMVARAAGRIAEIGRLEAANYPRLTERIRKLAHMGTNAVSSSGVLQFLWQGKRIPFQALSIGVDGGEYITLKLQISAPPLADLSDLELSPTKAHDLRVLANEKDGVILITGSESQHRCRVIDLFVDACDVSFKTVLLLGERLGHGRRRFPRIAVTREGVDDTASVLAAALDHDPDVLVVEDITEVGPFVEASKAAMRGKLVIAGMSHRDKESVLKQLLYLREKNYLIPTQLKGVVCCKSVQLLCQACKELYTPAPEELAALRLPVHGREYYRPRGCPVCDHTGYSSRRYLLEVLRFDQRLLEAFETMRKGSDILAFMKESGYRGIVEEGAELLERGDISPGEYVAAILL